jgi:hypothetical protein
MESPMPDGEKTTPSIRPARQRLSSRKVNTVTCVAGLAAAGFGLFGVLTHVGGAFDMVFLLGGLLVTLAGLILRGRSPRPESPARRTPYPACQHCCNGQGRLEGHPDP